MPTAPLVCIVDDGVDYRFLLQHVFNRCFPAYSASFFVDGKNFLDELPGLDQLPSLILLDRHMPNLDGHQTLVLLKAHPLYKKIPVVMMSADASAEEINGCYNSGVNSFLRKPIGFDLLNKQLSIICQYWLELNLKPVDLPQN